MLTPKELWEKYEKEYEAREQAIKEMLEAAERDARRMYLPCRTV